MIKIWIYKSTTNITFEGGGADVIVIFGGQKLAWKVREMLIELVDGVAVGGGFGVGGGIRVGGGVVGVNCRHQLLQSRRHPTAATEAQTTSRSLMHRESSPDDMITDINT